MDTNQPQAKFGTTDSLYECNVSAMPARRSIELRFPVMLTIDSPDRTYDHPIRVYLPAEHAIRLIKELASSVLADIEGLEHFVYTEMVGVPVGALEWRAWNAAKKR